MNTHHDKREQFADTPKGRIRRTERRSVAAAKRIFLN
jgi:hypothetical protein